MVNVGVSFGVRLILFFHFLTQRAYRSYKQGPRSDFTIVGGGGEGGWCEGTPTPENFETYNGPFPL